MRLLLPILLGLLAPAADAQREGPQLPAIVAGLAEETVEVKVNYSGARVVLFATGPAEDNEGSGIAVALIGPPQPQEVVRLTAEGEERFQFVSAPSVFAIAAEPQVTGAVAPEVMIEAGLNAAASAMPRANLLDSPELPAWRAAFVNLKVDQGLYSLDETVIDRLEGGLRRARIALPPDAPPGDYRIRAVAFRNGERIGESEQVLKLVRSGMDATLFELATSHGVVYGFIAVLLGTLVGAVGAWAGRR